MHGQGPPGSDTTIEPRRDRVPQARPAWDLRRVGTTLATPVVAVVLITALVVASSGVPGLPGRPLEGVRRTVERIQLLLADDPGTEGRLHLRFAAWRLSTLQTSAVLGSPSTVNATLVSATSHVASAAEHLVVAHRNGDDDALAALGAGVATHRGHVIALTDQVPIGSEALLERLRSLLDDLAALVDGAPRTCPTCPLDVPATLEAWVASLAPAPDVGPADVGSGATREDAPRPAGDEPPARSGGPSSRSGDADRIPAIAPAPVAVQPAPTLPVTAPVSAPDGPPVDRTPSPRPAPATMPAPQPAREPDRAGGGGGRDEERERTREGRTPAEPGSTDAGRRRGDPGEAEKPTKAEKGEKGQKAKKGEKAAKAEKAKKAAKGPKAKKPKKAEKGAKPKKPKDGEQVRRRETAVRSGPDRSTAARRDVGERVRRRVEQELRDRGADRRTIRAVRRGARRLARRAGRS